MKKKEPAPAPPAKPVAPEPAINDFFTAFLSKKKKPLLKKIERIEELKSKESLNKEQRDLVDKRAEIEGQIAQYDEIVALYTTAKTTQDEDSPNASKLPPAPVPTESIEKGLRNLLALRICHEGWKGELKDAKFEEIGKSHEKIFESLKLEEATEAAKKYLENKELNEHAANLALQVKHDQVKKAHKETHKEAHKEAHKETHKEAHKESHKETHKEVKPTQLSEIEKEIKQTEKKIEKHPEPKKEAHAEKQPEKHTEKHQEKHHEKAQEKHGEKQFEKFYEKAPEQKPEKKHEGKFLQSDEEDHPPKQTHAHPEAAEEKPQETQKKTVINLLPEKDDDKKNDEWIKVDVNGRPIHSNHFRGHHGNRNFRGNRDHFHKNEDGRKHRREQNEDQNEGGNEGEEQGQRERNRGGRGAPRGRGSRGTFRPKQQREGGSEEHEQAQEVYVKKN